MKKQLALYLTLSLTLSGFLQSCGQQGSTPSIPTPVDKPFVGSESVKEIISDFCATRGGDTDGDGSCNDDEEVLTEVLSKTVGADCKKTKDCDGDGVEDDDDEEANGWTKNPWKVALYGIAGTVMVAGASVLTVGIIEATNNGASSSAAPDETLKVNYSLEKADIEYITKKIEGTPRFILNSNGTMNKLVKMSVGKHTFGDKVKICIKSSIDKDFATLNAKDSSAIINLSSQYPVSEFDNIDGATLTKDTFNLVCAEGKEDGYWVGMELPDDPDHYFVTKLDLKHLAYVREKNTLKLQTKLQFKNLEQLSGTSTMMNLVDPKNKKNISGTFTLSEKIPLSSLCAENECRMRVLLSLPPMTSSSAINEATGTSKSFKPLENQQPL